MNIIQQIKQIASRSASLIKPDSDTVVFDGGDFEITKRELISSIVIIAIMLILGFSISGYIADKVEDKKRMYNQALQVETREMFEYGMATNVGNAFVYGELAAADTVNFAEVGGAYLWIEKEREEYTRHEEEIRQEVDGDVYYTTEVYYSWDYAGSESRHSEKITFLGVEFDYKKIERPASHYIDTIYERSDVRYVYYGVEPKHTGTIFTVLKDGTIEDNTSFYENVTIEEVLESKNEDISQFVFWLLWIIAIVAAVGGFYYLDNNWLD